MEDRKCEEVYEEPTVVFLEKPDPLNKWIWLCFIGSALLFLLAGVSV